MAWYEERSAEDRAMDRAVPEREAPEEPTDEELAIVREVHRRRERTPTKASACCPTCDLVFRETYAGMVREFVAPLARLSDTGNTLANEPD